MEKKKTVKTEKQKNEQATEIKMQEKKEKDVKKEKALNSETENKVSRYYGWTAYILFFIPLIFNAKNKQIRFHVNQGFWLNIAEIATGLLIWLFTAGYKSATLPTWIKSISFILFICGCLFAVLLLMIAFYLIFLCISDNGKEIKILNKIKVFNKEK